MGMVVPITSAPSPFGELESGSNSGPSEASMLMALQTMHKQGRFAQQEDDSDTSKTPRAQRMRKSR